VRDFAAVRSIKEMPAGAKSAGGAPNLTMSGSRSSAPWLPRLDDRADAIMGFHIGVGNRLVGDATVADS
jgi:hypothetical protein